ncbi:hypothetical protein AVEN_11365-1 [Araneus ventricosus]|uniref:Uncharacterized protein n=1 Tax=Araneus ventricosus TaxID=182803 RepID=A0A4Y2HCA4_ARAVE|nr:hypothetical protein AVEN_11365-1 [Araneus ventricosus]
MMLKIFLPVSPFFHEVCHSSSILFPPARQYPYSCKTQELLRMFKWEVWSHPCSPDLAPNLGSKHLSGKRFSSNSDVKTAAENWPNEQGRDINQSGFNKLRQMLIWLY